MIFANYFDNQDNEQYFEDMLQTRTQEAADRMQSICELIPSTMLAWQWCHTPWHLHHLPFQKQNAVFSQGEAFNPACNRCARKFHETEYMYYTEEKGATHLPHIMLKRLVDGHHMARIPLHDEQFWPDESDDEDEPAPAPRVAKGKKCDIAPNDIAREIACTEFLICH
jgi:hypothetical protein